MNKKVILLLTAVLLTGCAGSQAETDNSSDKTSNIVRDRTVAQTEDEPPEVIDLPEYSGKYAFGYAPGHFFIDIRDTDCLYHRLDEFDQKIYRCIVDAVNHTNYLEYGARMYVAHTDVDRFNNDFWFVYECMTNDHPELFDYELNEQDGLYPISIEFIPSDKSAYWYAVVKPNMIIEDFYERIYQLDEAAEDFLDTLDLSNGEYDIMLQIHDKLIDETSVNYDPDVEHEDDTKLGAYTALVGNINGEKKGVCNNYTKACGYLLKKCGITYAPKYGGLGYDTDYEKAYYAACRESGDHIWVMAELDGKWYETDVLWDDDDNYSSDPYRYFCLSSYEMVMVYDEENEKWIVHMPANDVNQDYSRYDSMKRMTDILPIAE